MPPKRQAINNQGTATQTTTLTINPTKSLVRINQKQSLHIVQTTISATLSAILYIRNLFPDDYFESRSYSLADPDFPYTVRSATSIAQTAKKQQEDNASVTWDILLKGKHVHADKILLWLDGVGDALKHKYLATLQISFHSGAVSRETVAEVYVMKFSYSGPDGEAQVDITTGNQSLEITAKDMQDLKHMFKRLMTLASRGIDELPERPTISMQLTYNDTCPYEYEPMGFIVAPDTRVIMDQGGFNVGEIDTRYHRLGMNLIFKSHLSDSGSNDSISQSETPPYAAQALNKRHVMLTQASSSPYDGSSTLNTQDSNERRQISAMVPMRRKIEDTQRIDDEAQIRSTLEDRESPVTPPPASFESVFLFPQKRMFHFPNEIVHELHPNQAQCIPRNEPVPISNVGRRDVKCDCTKEFDDKTMQCQICHERQHRRCYGYLDTDILLDTYICYGCLLYTEPGLLHEMKQLCLLRQTIWVVSMEKYPLKEADLAKRMGCLVKEIKSMSLKLVEDKYLRKIRSANAKKAKAFRKGPQLPPFEFITAERERLCQEYFNPTFKIEKYLSKGQHIEGAGPKTQQEALPTTSNSYGFTSSPEPARTSPTGPNKLLLTPKPKPAGTGAIYDIFDNDIDMSTPPRGDVSSTQGTPSHAGSPHSRQLAVLGKRPGEPLEGGKRRLKRPSWVNSPFTLRISDE